MSTTEVAKRFYELAQEGKWDLVLSELYSNDAESFEPSNGLDLPTVRGLDKIKEKAKLWESMIEEMHGGYTNEPQVAGDYFVCTMGVDMTMKGKPRTKIDEVALYQVKNGKIVKEQFFF